MGVAFIVHLFAHIAVLTVDPADDSVRAKQSYSTPMPLFDRTKQPHVIHDLHCYLCDVNVYVSWAAVSNVHLHFQIGRYPITNEEKLFLFFFIKCNDVKH